MNKKKWALATGMLSTIGLLAFLGHKKQVKNQETQEAILAQVRDFFAPMGTIEVVYVTEVNSRAGITRGGVVFDDGVIFEFQHRKGEIDYRQHEQGGTHD